MASSTHLRRVASSWTTSWLAGPLVCPTSSTWVPTSLRTAASTSRNTAVACSTLSPLLLLLPLLPLSVTAMLEFRTTSSPRA